KGSRGGRVRKSPSSAPNGMSAWRSSVTMPASGLAIRAQAATRVTGTIAEAPPSKAMVSFTITVRRISIISNSNKPIKIVPHDRLGLICRKRFANELHRLRLTESKRRIASHEQMLHRNGTRRILQNTGFKTDGIKIKTPQILAYRRFQGGRQLSIGI